MTDVFFGLQLAIVSPPGDPWRARLADLLRTFQRDLEIADQRGLYGALANALMDALPRATLGYWDFQADGAKEYADWLEGLRAEAETPWQPDPTGATMDHALVSMLLLAPGSSGAAMQLGEACDLPEPRWQDRDTFAGLVQALPRVSFASVRGDAVFVTPGSVDAAFSRAELAGEDYAHLQPMR
ncbi:MAG: hypothetical protein R3F56_13375 [Planctomycetota bacterium]